MPLKKIDEPLEYTPLLRPIYLSPSRIVLKWESPLDTASFFQKQSRQISVLFLK